MTVLPQGFGLALDRSVRSFRHGLVLVGGRPGRLLTLTADGARSVARLVAHQPEGKAGRQLGGRLVATGMAHPRRPVSDVPAADRSITVAVPARDRAGQLDHCLASLAHGPAVVVVDDGSRDGAAIASVCRRHRARLLRRADAGGPAAARNDALAVTATELVAMVDSDCTVPEGWLDGLTWLFDDPAVAAVAPRVRPGPAPAGASRSVLARFAGAASPLDLGPDEGEVGPGRAVPYVPTTALVARRAALGRGFDPALRVGEDVDLVWRMVDDGWRVRYEPTVSVRHVEPVTWRSWLGRRFRYGTSAGPLARRHRGRLAPLRLRPWPTLAVVVALSGRPRAALAVVVASAALTARRLRGTGVPPVLCLRWAVGSAAWTAVGAGRAATMLAGPLLVAASLTSRRRALVATGAVVVPALVEWWRRQPELDPVRWTLAWVADDVAYGAGVWVGCLRSGSAGPLLPALGSDEP